MYGRTSLPHWRFDRLSPNGRWYGTVDFHVERMDLSVDERVRLIRAFFTTGVIGLTSDDVWLYFSDGSCEKPEMSVATSVQVDVLPRLVDGWEDVMESS